MNELDHLAWWFVGLIDGEGCFMIRRKTGRTLATAFMPTFSLVLRDDDAEAILMVQEIMQFGIVKRRTFTSPGSHDGIGWHVYQQDELQQLVDFLDARPLRSKKAKDYKVWREAVLEYRKDVAARDGRKMEYLFNKIRLVRQYEPSELMDDGYEPDSIQLEFWAN